MKTTYFINGKTMRSVEDLDTCLADLQFHIDSLKQTNQEQKEEITKLKADNWKDNELMTLKAQIDKLLEEKRESYFIAEKERNAINDWKVKHLEQYHNGSLYDGAIGGNWVYEFTPTSIGTFGACICGACRRKVLKNYINNDNILDNYNEIIKDISFCFADSSDF